VNQVYLSDHEKIFITQAIVSYLANVNVNEKVRMQYANILNKMQRTRR